MAADWEFFYVQNESGPRGWGWRTRNKEIVIESHRLFEQFIACYRDAKDHGFEGTIDFAE